MMAKQQDGQDITNMTDQQMFEELIRIHAKAAEESLSSILKAEIEITNPEIREITVREVEYSILEPAIFVKSCLTSNVAGNMVMILRQRDMQAFLNELMGIDDLPDPDFVFDEVAMSAAGELMNQTVRASAAAMAEYLEDTMESSECQLVLSDGRQNLAAVIGEAPDSKTVAVHYHMKIKDIMESEFIECLSVTAIDSLFQEIAAVRAAKELEKEEAAPMVHTLARETEPAGARTVPSGQQQAGSRVLDYGQGLPPERQAIHKNLGLIMDVPLSVSVEIGKSKRRLKDVLNFTNGTVVELDKAADAPVDIIVNGQLIARGEVVVIDDNFGVRISEIVNTRGIIGSREI